MIFNGRSFADKKLQFLQEKIITLKKKNITPTLVSIVIGDEGGAMKYQKMKQKAALQIGAQLVIRSCDQKECGVIPDEIEKLNVDLSVHGIMVQLPIPVKCSLNTIINSISSQKDVDGMTQTSHFETPVVAAIMETLKEGERLINKSFLHSRVCVLGSKGFVGTRLMNRLFKDGWKDVIGVDIETRGLKDIVLQSEIVISVTGEKNIVTKEMVKDGVVLIDVGAPDGDINKEAYEKASFVSPVPGGVGPVTISCLLENLVASAQQHA